MMYRKPVERGVDFNNFNVLYEGSTTIPITDGSYYTNITPERFFDGVFNLAFFDSSGELVTPTNGTITPYMASYKHPTEDQYIWHEPNDGDLIISATDVICSADGIANYEMPRFKALSVRGRIDLLDIEGASYCQATFWRYL